MEQLSDDLNLNIFNNYIKDIDTSYNLIQLNRNFYTLYITKYKLSLQIFNDNNKWFYNESVWFM